MDGIGKTTYCDMHATIKDTGSARCRSQQPAGPAQDAVQLSLEALHSEDRTAAVQKMLDILRQSFPKINITVTEEVSGSALAQIAAQLGPGTHLLISQAFLDRMSSNTAQFETGARQLTTVLRQLCLQAGSAAGVGAFVRADSVTFWSASPGQGAAPDRWRSALDMIRSMLEQLEEQQKKWKNSFRVATGTPSYETAGSYARIARATSKAQVRAAMADVQGKIAELRMSACFCDDGDRAKIQAAIRSLQKLMTRGSRKVKRFDQETLLRMRKKRAQKQNQQKKAAMLRAELQRKRAARRATDRAIEQEGRMEDANNASRFRRRYPMPWEQNETNPMAAETAVPSAGAEIVDTFAAADVVLSPAVPLEA